MIWKVVDDAALQAEAEALTAHLATQPTAGAGGHEAHVRRLPRPTRSMRSSIWSATNRRPPRGARTMPRACAPSSRSARRCSGGAAHDRHRACTRRGDVGAGSRHQRPRHAPGRSRARPRPSVDDDHRGNGERPRHLPWRLHLHARRLRDGVRGQPARRAGGGAACRDHLRAARRSVGEALVAEAEERMHAGRSGIYDVRVTTADGELVAEFRGHTRTIRRRRRG